MKENPVAKRYAKAIFELAVEKNELDTVRRELLDFSEQLNHSSKIRAHLLTPKVAKPLKLAFLEKTVSENTSTYLKNFLKLLIIKSRLELHAQIAREFMRLYDKKNNLVHASVTSVVNLQEKELGRLEQILGGILQANVDLKNFIDAKIIGGLIIEVEGIRVDSSLKRKIEKLQESLIQAG